MKNKLHIVFMKVFCKVIPEETPNVLKLSL
jgi:hypothetical protein